VPPQNRLQGAAYLKTDPFHPLPTATPLQDCRGASGTESTPWLPCLTHAPFNRCHQVPLSSATGPTASTTVPVLRCGNCLRTLTKNPPKVAPARGLCSSCVLVGKSSVGQWHLLWFVLSSRSPRCFERCCVFCYRPPTSRRVLAAFRLVAASQRSIPARFARIRLVVGRSGSEGAARHPEQIKMPRKGQQGVRQRFSTHTPSTGSSKPTGNLGGTLATSTGSKRWVEGGFVYETDHLGRTTKDPLTTAPLR
jgi:hypothetical protein